MKTINIFNNKQNNNTMDAIIEQNDKITNMIQDTDTIYNNLIANININNKTKFSFQNSIVKIIEPVKYTYQDENNNEIISDLQDSYVFICDFIYAKSYNTTKKYNNRKFCGKWMLFGSLSELIEFWEIIKINTFENELGFFSKFVGDENNRVICVYFKDYRDKGKIMYFGNKIKEITNYPYPIYFKPNGTKNKKTPKANQSSIYRIDADECEFI